MGRRIYLKEAQEAGIVLGKANDWNVRQIAKSQRMLLISGKEKSHIVWNLRVKFAKIIQKLYSADVWKNHIAFYIDSVNFSPHKINPAATTFRQEKKGIMSILDQNLWVKFAKIIQKVYPADVWANQIAFISTASIFCIRLTWQVKQVITKRTDMT